MRLFVIRNSCGDPYLVRWSFFEIFGYSLKLHLILRSDDDRALHDHPWDFASLMLAGGYWEWRFASKKDVLIELKKDIPTIIIGHDEPEPFIRQWIKPGTFRICRSPHAHRLELVEEEPVARPTNPKLQHQVIEGFYHPNVKKLFTPAITLVFMWPKKREWGFYTKNGWLKWSEFLKNYTRHDC